MSVLGDALVGARVLDLFAGSGALGLEALSRGARRVTFVERSARVLACLHANIAALDATPLATVVRADVFDYLARLAAGEFDFAVADPPYGEGLADRLVQEFQRRPFARVLSVEHRLDDALRLPTGAEQRRYGDTVITFISAAELKEEGT